MSSASLNRSQSGGILSFWIPLVLALAILGIDFISKYWIQSNLPLHWQIPVLSWGGIDFLITFATNKGAAWGIFSNYQTYLFAFRIALVTGLIIYTLFYNTTPAFRWPFMLIIAGAVGNIVDFFVYGHVVDMFQFFFWGYSYPVFNVADSSIFIGVAWLFLLSWKKR